MCVESDTILWFQFQTLLFSGAMGPSMYGDPMYGQAPSMYGDYGYGGVAVQPVGGGADDWNRAPVGGKFDLKIPSYLQKLLLIISCLAQHSTLH